MTPPADEPTFVDTLHALAMPVVVVCARSGTTLSCATTTAMYAATAPAIVALSLRAGSDTLRVARESGRFTVSILSAAQAGVAAQAALPARTADKAVEHGIPMQAADSRFPGDSVADALAAWSCSIISETPAAGSSLLLASVDAVRIADTPSGALIRHGREYRTVGGRADESVADDYPV